jgi:integrase
MPSGPGPTLSVFVDEVWAPRARRRLAAKTWLRDSVVYGRHIEPRLGDMALAAIDSEALAEWQEELEADGVGGPTVIKAIGLLSSIFREAGRRSRSTGVAGNPTTLLERPRATRRRRPRVWGPAVIEKVRYELLVNSRRPVGMREIAGLRDSLLVGLMAMTGCRPGEALVLRWSDVGRQIAISRRLSGREILAGTKNGCDRVVPLLPPLAADLSALRVRSGDHAEEWIFRTAAGGHWQETDWRNYRRRHFVAALERVEADWVSWRSSSRSEGVRESVAGLAATRPYDLGRHTHSAMMLASGMSLQRLARIQGHGMRVLDAAYSEQLAEFSERERGIDPSRRSSEPGRSSGATSTRVIPRRSFVPPRTPTSSLPIAPWIVSTSKSSKAPTASCRSSRSPASTPSRARPVYI